MRFVRLHMHSCVGGLVFFYIVDFKHKPAHAAKPGQAHCWQAIFDANS